MVEAKFHENSRKSKISVVKVLSNSGNLDTQLNCKERTKFPPVTLEKDTVYEGEWLKGKRDGYGK